MPAGATAKNRHGSPARGQRQPRNGVPAGVEQIVMIHHRECRLDLFAVLSDPPGFEFRGVVYHADGAYGDSCCVNACRFAMSIAATTRIECGGWSDIRKSRKFPHR